MVGKAFSDQEFNARETPSSFAPLAIQSDLLVSTKQRQSQTAVMLEKEKRPNPKPRARRAAAVLSSRGGRARRQGAEKGNWT